MSSTASLLDYPFHLLKGTVPIGTHWDRFASRGFFKIHRFDPVRNQFDDQFEHVKVFGGGLNRDR